MTDSAAPNFVPPKKRSTGKKGPVGSGHGDFIMNVHGRSPVTSPSDEELDKIDQIGEGEPMVVSSSATPDSHLLDSFSTDQSPSPSLDTLGSNRRKKKVNICTENSDDPLVGKATTSSSGSLDKSDSGDNFLTLTGTIKRGRKAGQNVDVKLNMSREELEILEASITEGPPRRRPCFGLHILLFSVALVPAVCLAGIVYNFYVGTLTWYNIFTHFSNGHSKVLCGSVFLPPLLLLGYPFFIVGMSLLLGLYAGVSQVSLDVARWKAQVHDLEKGFFGSMCSALGLEDCSPYEVVILIRENPATPQET